MLTVWVTGYCNYILYSRSVLWATGRMSHDDRAVVSLCIGVITDNEARWSLWHFAI